MIDFFSIYGPGLLGYALLQLMLTVVLAPWLIDNYDRVTWLTKTIVVLVYPLFYLSMAIIATVTFVHTKAGRRTNVTRPSVIRKVMSAFIKPESSE
jgi:hypothetical protein